MIGGGRYILDRAGNPVPCPNLMTWARWYEVPTNRVVASTFYGPTHVSTVFLALDHDFTGEGPPVLWETMIFGGEHDGYQERYTSRQEALEGPQEGPGVGGRARWWLPELAHATQRLNLRNLYVASGIVGVQERKAGGT
jgi:hypothetical protein